MISKKEEALNDLKTITYKEKLVLPSYLHATMRLEKYITQSPTLELVEDNYEYIVKVNGIARAVPKKCFKLIEELLNK